MYTQFLIDNNNQKSVPYQSPSDLAENFWIITSIR